MELTMTRMQSRQRLLIGAALVALTLLAWAYLIMPAGDAGMDSGMGASMASSLDMLALSITMWSIMMVAMMLPGAGPMILTYARIHQQRRASGSSTVPVWVFLTGYLTVWVGVGIAAALLQWGLHQSALLSSAMGRVGPLLAGGLLITAGAFQFSHLKRPSTAPFSRSADPACVEPPGAAERFRRVPHALSVLPWRSSLRS